MIYKERMLRTMFYAVCDACGKRFDMEYATEAELMNAIQTAGWSVNASREYDSRTGVSSDWKTDTICPNCCRTPMAMSEFLYEVAQKLQMASRQLDQKPFEDVDHVAKMFIDQALHLIWDVESGKINLKKVRYV